MINDDVDKKFLDEGMADAMNRQAIADGEEAKKKADQEKEKIAKAWEQSFKALGNVNGDFNAVADFTGINLNLHTGMSSVLDKLPSLPNVEDLVGGVSNIYEKMINTVATNVGDIPAKVREAMKLNKDNAAHIKSLSPTDSNEIEAPGNTPLVKNPLDRINKSNSSIA